MFKGIVGKIIEINNDINNPIRTIMTEFGAGYHLFGYLAAEGYGDGNGINPEVCTLITDDTVLYGIASKTKESGKITYACVNAVISPEKCMSCSQKCTAYKAMLSLLGPRIAAIQQIKNIHGVN